ncbi:uncharacterized protein LOC113517503 [Galleria mellonella]|uniref:Uncharacterized protein LOC113517503 n=1 Tax=Galleria mellonella TaxID=7137 RepID=A0A6J1WRN9_GALME|nr:uncharacterized protein LOC113517503 [Galleria mellonella]
METVTKARTPSRCREWERQRRNKFNEAISKLGEVVKAINKANESSEHDADVQYPKIEIIQKAIICLTNCAQEKTQLKAEILALQVKLDDHMNKKLSLKDASTQVFIGINKKNQNSKYMKLMMLQKSKRNALKEKPTLTTNVTVKSCCENTKSIPKSIPVISPPKLLPKSNLNIDKKGPENTIVVLPATPYIFPQRPLLFPTVPPAFVIVDSYLQTLNKPFASIVNRNNGDITKTTMVNILPISAYSRPLSAADITKNKKNNAKSKNDVAKKSGKKIKSTPSIEKDSIVQNIKEKEAEKEDHKTLVDSKITDKKQSIEKCPDIKKVPNQTSAKSDTQSSNSQDLSNSASKDNDSSSKIKSKESNCLPKNIETTKTNSESAIVTKVSTAFEKNTNEGQNTHENDKFTKVATEIETLTEDKDKENKLPNILDTTLCDNVVETGNARLELAEEFLAASPTAAFLMSFPLVSGNRADSPAEEPQNSTQTNIKDNSQRRNDTTSQPVTFYEKINSTDIKIKSTHKTQSPTNILNKHNEQQKYIGDNVSSKEVHASCKTTSTAAIFNVTHENPFLNLPMPSLISTNCTISDSTFGLDFDCNISKSISNQPTSYVSNNNFFYKGDPFSTVKSTIYSTSNISSGHEFNSLGLYPCAMEKYTSKNKNDYTNVEDNLMKIGSSRLTYDIDLGWSHKGFDFVNCTTSTNTFSKEILTTVSTPYSNSYNPFNPEFQLPLVTSSNKKDNTSTKPNSSFADTITSFYSQPTNIWSDDVPFYTHNNNSSKSLNTKHQNYLPPENMQTNINIKSSSKHYETKQISETVVENGAKSLNMTLPQQASEKYTKKSPSKMHINWMTSEIRPMSNHCIPNHVDIKESHKSSYGQSDLSQITKKQDHNESNYFPISMHNFSTQSGLEELQVWPSARPVGPTEISIEPPPINLPTLVGDLALGPHDKKKNSEFAGRGVPQSDIQNCSNFLSVTQLMNRSSDSMPSRYQAPNIEPPKSVSSKQPITHFANETNRKVMSSRIDTQTQPCYTFNDSKTIISYDNMNQFSQNKPKTNKSDKSSKSQKNSYSAEALIRGGSCSQKNPDSSTVKFTMPAQKYNNFNPTQENSIAQVSHFPPILDYTDNSYASQQLSGTTLYNTTTNTISNSFYSNFMPGSSNLMSGNYASGPFPGEFMDYNQTPECNYTNHKYEELKMRNNPAVFQQQDKVPSSYKSSRRETAAKHKLECSKKDSNKKYQSKRAKLNNEVDEWNDPSHILWQNKAPSKRHSNLVTDELGFPNYVGNQVPTQYQSDFFNSHLMSSSMQSVGHNVDRSLTGLPVTSRANFNLSSIFPEITMKVQ